MDDTDHIHGWGVSNKSYPSSSRGEIKINKSESSSSIINTDTPMYRSMIDGSSKSDLWESEDI